MSSTAGSKAPPERQSPSRGGLDSVALVAGAALAAAALSLFVSDADQDFAELALGEETRSYYARVAGDPIHCQDVSDAQDCIGGHAKRGGHPVILWLGNSQLHAINQPREGDETAPALLHRSARERGRDVLAFSQPNASPQEHLVLFAFLAERLPLDALVLPVVFDDFRESGVRQGIVEALAQQDVVETLTAHEVGRTILANNAQLAGGNLAALQGTVQERSEAAVTRWLDEHWKLWELRPQARGSLLANLHLLRNRVFSITAQSKRPVIPGRLDLNLAATRALLGEARQRGIRVLLYVVPLRDDVAIPYVESEYEDFKQAVERLAGDEQSVYANLEDLVPAAFWGSMNTARSGGPVLDFMHFQGRGHELLAAEIGEILSRTAIAGRPMIFNSVTFLAFLGMVLGLYWVLPRRARLWMLFLASLTFYGFWRVEFLPVMLASTVVDYAAARGIHGSADRGRRRLYLALSLVVNLGLLFYFKYLIFAATNVSGLLQFLGFDVAPPGFSIVLPLGISFYTFQTISYTVDVYRGFIKPEREFVLYGCYVTFFPQLVAGPILRAREVIPQLTRRPRVDLSDLTVGASRVLSGLFLKVVLADNLAPLVDAGFAMDTAHLSAIDVWTLAFLFGFQIYFDFSGYSHVALGCARMMGIRFPENFDFPYLATSPREFWRRWHISLSSWIRDYLYLPLCGERVRDDSVGGLEEIGGPEETGTPRRRNRDRALFESWAIMGLWHGANWTFVLWGVYHAALVFAHRKLSPRSERLGKHTRSLGGFAITLPLSMLGWIPFRADSLTTSLVMMGKTLNPFEYTALGMRENTYLVAALVLFCMICAYATREWLLPHIERSPVAFFAARATAFAVMIGLVFVFLRPISQFIYFQF